MPWVALRDWQGAVEVEHVLLPRQRAAHAVEVFANRLHLVPDTTSSKPHLLNLSLHLARRRALLPQLLLYSLPTPLRVLELALELQEGAVVLALVRGRQRTQRVGPEVPPL